MSRSRLATAAKSPPIHKPTPDAPSRLHPYRDVALAHTPPRHCVARVAVAALPIRFHFLAEILEDETSATLCRLTVLHHGAQLGAILHATRFVVREVRAEIDRRQALGRQALPTSATILTHEAVSLEQHENDSGLPSGNARLVSEIVDMDLLAMRHLLERDGDARRLLHVGILAAEKVRLHATVFDAIQHRARRGLAIASSAPGLLIVRLDASRKVIVNDEADVALVDAEAKCVRGNHRFEAIGHESVLHVLAVGGRHLPVVQTNGHVAAELP